MHSSAVGEKRRYRVTGVRRRLETVVCLPSAASHLSTAALRPPVVVSELLLEESFITSSTGGTLNPFCVSKYFRLPITQSQKSEKGPINLRAITSVLPLAAGVMENNPLKMSVILVFL